MKSGYMEISSSLKLQPISYSYELLQIDQVEKLYFSCKFNKLLV